MTYENTLVIQSFLFNALSEVGKIELSNNKLSFTSFTKTVELSINPTTGVTITDLHCLINAIAK